MSAKLLNDLPAEKQRKLHKQAGCMMGIFQMLDRRRLLSGRRLSRKQLPDESQRPPLVRRSDVSRLFLPNLSRVNENLTSRKISLQEKNSSRASSYCSSSLSSLDPPAATSRRQPPLDFRDVVKDAMTSRDCTGSLSAIKTSSTRSSKPHVDSPRPSLPAAPPPAREAARSSLDSQNRPSARLHDLPRWSLDSKQAAIRNPAPKSNLESRSYTLMNELAAIEQRRPAGVVAKLMGLEELPTSNDRPNSPSLQQRDADLSQNGVTRKHISVEPAPWKQRKQPQDPVKQPSKEFQTLERILEAVQAKGLLHENRGGSQHRSESPIVIMKPARPTARSTHAPPSSCSSSSSSSSVVPLGGPTGIRRIRTRGSAEGAKERGQQIHIPHGSPRSPQLTKENGVRGRSAVSPRLQKKSEPAEPKKQQSIGRHGSAVNDLSTSPRARTPPARKAAAVTAAQPRNNDRLSEIPLNRMRAEVNARLPSSPGRKSAELASILIQREKDLHECVKVEQPSPDSVLDSSFYRDDSPASPIKKAHNLSRVRRLFLEEEDAKADSCRMNSSIESTRTNVDRLLQKLWQLSLSKYDDTGDDDTDDDDNDDRREGRKQTSSLIAMDNPRHQYVYEILRASGFLGTDSDGPTLTTRLHETGRTVDPCLFLALEKSNRSWSKREKLCRQLLFDSVNEALTHKVKSSGLVNNRLMHGNWAGEDLLKELCMEIDMLNARHSGGAARPDDEAADALKPLVCEHVAQQSEGWASFGEEISAIVLDIERTIFKDLVSELVNGDMATALTFPTRLDRNHRRLLFRSKQYGRYSEEL